MLLHFDQDVWETILFQIRKSTRGTLGFLQQLTLRCVCKHFAHLECKLTFDDDWLELDTWQVSPYIAQDKSIQAYDLDESQWVQVADLRMGFDGIFEEGPKGLFRNPISLKYLFYTKKKWVYTHSIFHWWNRDKLVVPKQTQQQLIQLQQQKRYSTANFGPPNKSIWSRYISLVCFHLQQPTNKHIRELHFQNPTTMDPIDIEHIGACIPNTNITYMNVPCSGHPIFKILLNSANIITLNLSHHDALKPIDIAALFFLVKTSTSLKTLRIIHTHLSNAHEEITLVMLCASRNVQDLGLKFHHQSFWVVPKNHVWDWGNIRQITYQDPHHGMGILQIPTIDFATNDISDLEETLDYCLGGVNPKLSYELEFIISVKKLYQRVGHEQRIPLDVDSMIHDHLHGHLPSVQKAIKKTKRQLYDERNRKRNMLLDEARVCSACGTEWPAGSIKKQTFEGLQSNCKLLKRKCSQSCHFQLLNSTS